MKTSKTKIKTKTAQPKAAVPHGLIERKMDDRRFIQFPRMKGRTLDKIELYTTAAYHSLTLNFQDKTSLTLVIEPCFLMRANLSDVSTGDQRILKRWPVVHSSNPKP